VKLVVRLWGVKLKGWMRLWRGVWLQKGVSIEGMKLQRGEARGGKDAWNGEAEKGEARRMSLEGVRLEYTLLPSFHSVRIWVSS
jgi:hypothetical protein